VISLWLAEPDFLLAAGRFDGPSSRGSAMCHCQSGRNDTEPPPTDRTPVYGYYSELARVQLLLRRNAASDILQSAHLADQQFRIENGQPVIAEGVQQRLDESLAQFVANLEIRRTVH
jgi:hypothetical protein